MPHWEYLVDVKDIWGMDVAFEEKRDEIVKRIRESKWFADMGQETEGDYTGLADVVDGLATSTTVDVFDSWWAELYDYADQDRAWIATF